MYRTRRTLLGVVTAVAAAGLLAGCGDEESTATSTPSLSTPATTPSASSAPAPVPEGQESAAPAPEEESPAPEPPPEQEAERPAPVPPQDTSDAELGDKEQTFMDELAKQGVTPSGPETALSIANFVCNGVANGTSDAEMLTWVSAMAGSDATFDPAKMPVHEAGQIYVDTAKAHYC